MKFSDQIPPIYQRCRATFGPSVDWDKGVIFTYGDTVHSKRPLTPDLMAHEGVHVAQQAAMGADAWWDRYLADPSFRLSQELDAYRAQVRWIDENVKDRNARYFKKRFIYQVMGSSVYGNMVTPNEAKALIEGVTGIDTEGR